MFRIHPARVTRVAVTASVLSCGLQVTSGLETTSRAAGSTPVTMRLGPSVNRAMVGRVESATKHSLVLVQLGSTALTHIQLTAVTQYVVHGRRVAKQPSWTRGLQIRVTTTGFKGPYTAHIVSVGPVAVSTAPTGSASSPRKTNASLSNTKTLTGVVLLTSSATVTLQTSGGTTTIKLTSATRYAVKGKMTALKPTLHAGEKVRVLVLQAKGVLVGQRFMVS